MHEPYLTADGSLVSEGAWRSLVEELETNASVRGFADKKDVLLELEKRITTAILARIPSNERVAVLFSGGIDSTLIAFLLKQHGCDPLCITIGFQDGNAKEPEDVTESKLIAQELGFEQITLLLNLDEAEQLFRRTVQILSPELSNVVNVGVGSVVLAGIEKAQERGITHVFSGLGSEELFAGYDRHEKALTKGGYAALRDECIVGLKGMHARDLRRDCAIAAASSVIVHTPFLDEDLIRFSLGIAPEYKIGTGTFIGRARGDVPAEKSIKKLILREAAVRLGLPEHAAYRPKRAAQYGSRTNNALTMLAERKGFAFKDEYVKSLLS